MYGTPGTLAHRWQKQEDQAFRSIFSCIKFEARCGYMRFGFKISPNLPDTVVHTLNLSFVAQATGSLSLSAGLYSKFQAS